MNIKKLVLLFAIFFGDIVSALEEPEFKVVDKNLNFEIRYYNEYLVAEVTLDGDFSSSGNQAFRVLAGYIFGANQAAEKMAMTAPVESQLVANSEKMAMTAPVLSLKNEDKHIYRFVMEKKYTLDSLPIPDDKRIRLLKIEPRYMAVKLFSGRWSEKNYKKEEQQLLNDLYKNNIKIIGAPIFARYNAPFVPWFLRRNEVMIEINWRN
ncbi:heme-binding protein [Woeseiaceae bacterium]|nr:heme-binding protein [Woeseiaceae bacterium]